MDLVSISVMTFMRQSDKIMLIRDTTRMLGGILSHLAVIIFLHVHKKYFGSEKRLNQHLTSGLTACKRAQIRPNWCRWTEEQFPIACNFWTSADMPFHQGEPMGWDILPGSSSLPESPLICHFIWGSNGRAYLGREVQNGTGTLPKYSLASPSPQVGWHWYRHNQQWLH